MRVKFSSWKKRRWNLRASGEEEKGNRNPSFRWPALTRHPSKPVRLQMALRTRDMSGPWGFARRPPAQPPALAASVHLHLEQHRWFQVRRGVARARAMGGVCEIMGTRAGRLQRRWVKQFILDRNILLTRGFYKSILPSILLNSDMRVQREGYRRSNTDTLVLHKSWSVHFRLGKYACCSRLNYIFFLVCGFVRTWERTNSSDG